MPQPKDTSVDRLVDELVDAAKVIHNRDGLKPTQATRVSEAFSLLVSGPQLGSSKAVANRKVYFEFLTLVDKNVGRKGVVLCAAALGVSRVASWRDRMRVDLPIRIKEREGELMSQKLEVIANTCESTEDALQWL
ncbi:hypothetical protein LEL_08981 [Akanthomyces lecanii RCEF 1005]|uniref:Uncharacterized protein n=1 Tax=Akanthomyces lecanii RCEF 1005 TaxID=1081108 RepID=A0A168CSR1_CORDF|nr:hypothetical protein LEL_08981 [Akanthomyces lecanii RCEF 1005]